MDLRNPKLWIAGALAALALAAFFLLGGRRSAAELKQNIDDASSAFTGHQALRCGKEAEAEVRSISREWTDRIREAERQ